MFLCLSITKRTFLAFEAADILIKEQWTQWNRAQLIMHLCPTVWPQGWGCWKIEVICSPQVVSDPFMPPTHRPTQCSAPWTVKQQALPKHPQLSRISADPVHYRVTVYMRGKYLWGYLLKPYVDKHQQGVCNVCVRVPLWRMAVEVTSLKSIHWWGPACDPGPLRHINHDPFLLAFIRPAESYCPDSATTPPSLITSLLWPFIRLSSTLGHRYHSITTHLSGAPLIS